MGARSHDTAQPLALPRWGINLTVLTGGGGGLVTSVIGEGLRHRPHGGPGGT